MELNIKRGGAVSTLNLAGLGRGSAQTKHEVAPPECITPQINQINSRRRRPAPSGDLKCIQFPVVGVPNYTYITSLNVDVQNQKLT